MPVSAYKRRTSMTAGPSLPSSIGSSTLLPVRLSISVAVWLGFTTGTLAAFCAMPDHPSPNSGLRPDRCIIIALQHSARPGPRQRALDRHRRASSSVQYVLDSAQCFLPTENLDHVEYRRRSRTAGERRAQGLRELTKLDPAALGKAPHGRLQRRGTPIAHR